MRTVVNAIMGLPDGEERSAKPERVSNHARCRCNAILFRPRRGFGDKPSCRPRVVLTGSPFETGSEVKELPSCAGKAAPVGQLAELAGHFSIMAQPTTPVRPLVARPRCSNRRKWARFGGAL